MSLLSRSRMTLLSACAALPAVVLLSACGSDSSTSPKSAPGADTVAVNQSTALLIEHWVQPGSDSGFYVEIAGEDGNYVETESNGSYRYEYRMLIPFSLPTLAGRGAVDSAKVYQYACSQGTTATDSIVVDHVNGAVEMDSASFSGNTLQANIGTFDRSDSLGWRALNVTSAVQADYVAKRPTSQFRFQYLYSTFPTSNNQYVEFAGEYCDDYQPGAVGGNGYLVIWSH
jgi:hypothetical protein